MEQKKKKSELKNKHYKALEQMYLSAPLHKFYEDIEIFIGERKAQLNLNCDNRYFHAAHAVHGSIYFKLLDDAAFFAANSVEFNYFLVTSSFNLSLLRPIQNERVSAFGKIEHESRNLIIASSFLLNEKGRKLAVGRGQFVRSSNELSPELGYNI